MKSISYPSANQPAAETPAFYKLSSAYFGAETTRNQAQEFVFFTLLGLITAWPIISMVAAAARLLVSLGSSL